MSPRTARNQVVAVVNIISYIQYNMILYFYCCFYYILFVPKTFVYVVDVVMYSGWCIIKKKTSERKHNVTRREPIV